ncbi:DUF4391 domain-containing protein [Methanocorpusculum labreanum]|nr:DUF4391 domain-containing protein [Methanocorpusculum labreanum]
MLGIPDECSVERNLDVKRLPLSEVKPGERNRFRDVVRELKVSAVLTDKVLPAYTTERCIVQAVQVFEVRVNSLRSAPFVCGVLQKMTKTLCIIFVRDDHQEQFSFALKRLNLQYASEVVVTDQFLSVPRVSGVSGNGMRLMEMYAGWGVVVNMTSLYSWYLELMVKCFVITHRKVWSGMEGLLSSKVWYNSDDVLSMFSDLKRLVGLSEERGRSLSMGESVRLNGELREVYERLERYA